MRTVITLWITALCTLCGGHAAVAADQPRRAGHQAESPASAAPTVLSIIPAQAEPGGRVLLLGSGFGDRASVFLGSVEIPAKVTDGRQVEFIIPSQLEPGVYALYPRRANGATGRSYNFVILPLRPVLSGLLPDRITSCAQGSEREVSLQGQNFSEKSQLFFDGAVIRSRFVSPESIVFTVPQVPGGLHQVMVKNAPDNASVPMALAIDTRPEITAVTVGNEYVNYYELIIEGKNFEQNSSIFVDGQRVGGRGGQETLEQRERLIYVDCNRLVYQRYPYSPVNKDFRIQVISQGGEGSQVVNVTAP